MSRLLPKASLACGRDPGREYRVDGLSISLGPIARHDRIMKRTVRQTAEGEDASHAHARDSGLPALLTVEEAADVLRVGRNTCYELIRQHQVPYIRLGRLIRIPRHALMNWIGQKTASSAPSGVIHLPPSHLH